MTHVLNGLIPDDFDRWRNVEVLKLPDRTVVTARRTGVTIMLVCVDGWWTVTKMHKGQQIGCKVVKKLPKKVLNVIEERRRNPNETPRLSYQARRAKRRRQYRDSRSAISGG